MSTKKGKRPTIQDVAREAGVSYGTVSRVINSHPEVAPETRARVQRVIKKMGYQRNLGAQMLTTHRSNIIEFIVMDVYFGIVLPHMAQYINAAGYSTLYTECTQENFAETLDTAAARLVDGILLYAPKLHIPDDDLLEMCHGIPIVRRDYVLDSKLTWVGYSQEHATRLVVRHLIDLGHRRIVHVAGPASRLTGIDRQRGFERAMRDAGIPFAPEATIEGDFSFCTGEQLTPRILRQEPTAVFAGGDALAMGVLRGMHLLGRRVPEDISLIAFGNPDFVRYPTPAMTTIDLPVSEAGQAAVELALRRLQYPEEREVRTLTTKLLVRESTAPPPMGQPGATLG